MVIGTGDKTDFRICIDLKSCERVKPACFGESCLAGLVVQDVGPTQDSFLRCSVSPLHQDQLEKFRRQLLEAQLRPMSL